MNSKSCFMMNTFLRSCSSKARINNSQVTQKKNELFGREKARQASLITRIEKIRVDHKGPPEECTLMMNKGLSTPFNCAMHIQELLMTRSVLALVNGQPWDMHRPLENDCEISFVHFKDDNPQVSNEAYWRTGSFILGYILERAFKDEHSVELCSFPKPNVRSGSFVYDAELRVPNWSPTMAEMNCLSRIGGQLGHEDSKFERLDMDASAATKIFEDCRFKSQQIPQIAAQSSTGHNVTVYRMGDHVDITRGPLLSSTQQIGRFNVSKIHDIDTPDFGLLKRIQGISIPKQLPIHYWTYERLCERAEKLNEAPFPWLHKEALVAMEKQNGS